MNTDMHNRNGRESTLDEIKKRPDFDFDRMNQSMDPFSLLRSCGADTSLYMLHLKRFLFERQQRFCVRKANCDLKTIL